MKKILLATLTAAVVISGGLFANGQSEGGLDVGLAMPETHVERWQQDGAELKAQAEKMGYVAEVSFGDADQSKQNQQIDDFITKGAKLLVVGSVNEGVGSVVADAARDGIEVIAYDRLITNSGDYDYYITFDNFKVGQFQGEGIATGLDLANAAEPKYITLFAGSPTDNNANFFFDGAMSVLKPYVDAGKLVVVGPAPMSSADKANFTKIATENWRPEIAKARMENLLNNDAKDVVLDAVLAPNDTLARAIIEACMTDAKYDSVEKLPVISGQDGEVASVKYIRDGKQYMTVFKDTRDLAKAAIVLADAIIKGEEPSVPGARLDTSSYDTGKKVVKSYLLEPVMVTSANYKEVFIGSGYYSEADLK
jgi:putative multiple sugar transport system substrate-binding protein